MDTTRDDTVIVEASDSSSVSRQPPPPVGQCRLTDSQIGAYLVRRASRQ